MRQRRARRPWLRDSAAKLLAGSAILNVALATQPAAADEARPNAVEPPIVSTMTGEEDGYVDRFDRVWTIPRRAPRELMTKGHEGQVAEPLVHVDSSALLSPLPASPVDGTAVQARGLVIAGIRLNAGCTGATLNPRLLNDTRCNGSFKCAGERGARSDGYSLGKVSPAGWIVGALNTTVGALLLLTNKRKADAQTSIGADVYNHGGGLKIRRQF